MVKVSVVVPVYNTEKYLRKCLDSLVKQTLSDIEIVVVDDGSTDNSSQIIEQYVRNYPKMLRVITKDNGGQASARNLGIEKCQGEYIGFVDSDDFVEQEMYEKLYKMAVAENADLVECGYHYVEETDAGYKHLKEYASVRQYKSSADMFRNPLVSPWNKLVKREILQKMQPVFPEKLIYEDTSFFVKMIPMIKKSAYIDEKFVWHINRGDSTMNANRSKRVENIFLVLENAIKWYQDNSWYEEYFPELESFCVKILLCSSLERISKIADKGLRNSNIKKTIDMLDTYFKDFRKNSLITKSGVKGLYMRSVNGITIKGFVILFRLKYLVSGGARQ